MDISDPYRSTNPWALTRYLKNGCTVCPVCRERCAFDIFFDPEEEIINVTSDCGKCGKTELFPFVEENGDIAIVVKDSDEPYEPDQTVHSLWNSSEIPSTEDADPETLGKLSMTAKRYSETRRVTRSIELGKAVAEEYNKHIGNWDGAENKCLAQSNETANVLIGASRNRDALELFNRYSGLTENNLSGTAFAFIIARAFSIFADGDAKEPTAAVRGVIAVLDRMKSEKKIPSDDPFIRSRAYEALAVLLSAKNDKTGSMKAMKKALEDSVEVLSDNLSDDGLRWMNRCAREYAFACSQADMKKRSMEALKDSIKYCSARRDIYPRAYAEALLERGMFISDSKSEIPPYLRKDMDEAIEILSRPDEDGKYDPLLPIAYYYRSMTGADKEKLDKDDLERAYSIIRDGVNTGDVPDSVLTSVMDTYATFLDVYDEEKSKQVRRELAEMGIWVHPPVRKKS